MNPEGTLQVWASALREGGSKPAVIAFGKEDAATWSFATLADQAETFARGLRANGIGPNENVAVFAETRPEWIVAALGVLRAGCVVVPLDVQLSESNLRHILENSRCAAIVTTSRRRDRLRHVSQGSLPPLILMDESGEAEESWERWLVTAGEDRFGEAAPGDVAVLFYTSGTTGAPKGVPLTHENLLSQLGEIRELDFLQADDRALLPLPLHHIYPFVVGMLAPLSLRLPLILPASLGGQQLVRALREGGATVIIGVPRLYRALFSGIETRVESAGKTARFGFRALLAISRFLRKRFGLRVGKRLFASLHRQFGRDLRILASGGAALEPSLGWNLEALGWQVAVGYGLTETSPLLTLNLPDEGRMGTAGKPFPGVELRIDPSRLEGGKGSPAEGIRNEVGEIQARGPNVFGHYLNRPEATREAFTEDGWFRTEDMGVFDDEGFLHILGRISTLIVTESGEKVQPEEVEATYEQEDAIEEIGVLEEAGEVVALVLPAQRDRDPAEVEDAVREAMNAAAQELPSYARVGDFVLTREALPRTRLGKLKRKELQERFERARSGQEDEGAAGPMSVEEMSGQDRALLEEEDTAAAVWDLLARRFPKARLTPDTNPHSDLGIDSMGWLDLSLEIGERTGVELDDERIARIHTVRDLLEEVSQADAEGTVADPLGNPENVLDDRQRRFLEPHGPLTAIASRLGYGLNGVLLGLAFRPRVEGLENLPREGPYVITPNHTSYLDGPVLAAALGARRLRDTYWVGARDILLSNAFLRLVTRLAKVLPIDTRARARSGLALAALALKKGNSLIWFPEGWLSRTGELQKLKPGTGLLLERHRIPVVPVSIRGTFQALPPGRRFPRFRTVTVTFQRPVSPDALEEQGEGEKPYERIVDGLRDEMAAAGASRRSGERPATTESQGRG